MDFSEYASSLIREAGFKPVVHDRNATWFHVGESEPPLTIVVRSFGRTDNADWLVEFALWRASVQHALLRLFANPFIARNAYIKHAYWGYGIQEPDKHYLTIFCRIRSNELDIDLFEEIIDSILVENDYYAAHFYHAHDRVNESRIPASETTNLPVYNPGFVELMRKHAISLGWRIAVLRDGRVFIGFMRGEILDQIFVTTYNSEEDGDIFVEFTSGGRDMPQDDTASRQIAYEYLRRNGRANLVFWGVDVLSETRKVLKVFRNIRLSRITEGCIWNVVTALRGECELMGFEADPPVMLRDENILEIIEGGSE